MTARKPPPIDGAALLDRIADAITRYVILPDLDSLYAVVLWIAATHGQPAWAHAPRLVIKAPEKRCGKSRLLDLVEALCHAAIMTANASVAAVYRAVGESDVPPTLLLDEADTIFGPKAGDANEELRGLLNAGHQRGRPTIRWDPNTRRLERIQTFAMAALAGIGSMPDTIEDRAVVIRMRRRVTGEWVAPYRHRRDRPPLTGLAEQLAAWIGTRLPDLERAEPLMPVEDRAADTWEPLVAVADLAGGHWPDRARTAAVQLTAERDRTADLSDRIRLLADIRDAFATAEALPTVTLIDRLRADPESPWVESGPSGLNPRRLAAMLHDYDIASTNIRFGEPIGQAKGYTRADFEDAWSRYLPATGSTAVPDPARLPSQPSQPSPPSSALGRQKTWDGSIRPTKFAVPGLTSHGTAGTDGTATPRLTVIHGDAS